MNVEAAYRGQGHFFTFEGKEWPVGLITGKIQEGYERLLKAKTVDKARRNRAKFGNKRDYLAELRLIDEKENRGDYSFTVNQGGLLTTWGMRTMLGLLIPTAPPEVLERMLDTCWDELQVLLAEILLESRPATLERGKKQDPFEDTADESPPID